MLKKRFPDVPILGLTATATEKVKNDIAKHLCIRDHVIYFQNSFNRPNLIYEIRNKKKLADVERDVKNLLTTRLKD